MPSRPTSRRASSAWRPETQPTRPKRSLSVASASRAAAGTVIVPLLIFWFAYGERLATGTSLAAIVLIGALGAVAQGGIYGNVHVLTGLLLAIPAVLGVVIGTAIQQRIPQRAVSYLFAALLIGIAIELIVK